MKREIVLQDQTIIYTVRTNARLRNLRMVIDPDDGLIVTIPNAWHDRFIEPFLLQKSSWILKHLAHAKKQMEGKIVIQFPKEEYEYNKNTVRKMVTERVEFFNSFYKFSYNKISIKNQTSVWGSCSRSGNLQFNYKLVYVPEKTMDYVIVHEICHLKEHNHGPNFWKLVEKMIPDYKAIRRSLRNYVMKES